MTPIEMSLEVMWKGMVSIIIVIAIIIICTYLLQYINNKYDAYKKAKLEKVADSVEDSDSHNKN